MMGWAGSSFYWMRYMDPHNEKSLQQRSLAYWESVDLYIGGNDTYRTLVVLVFGINF
jgi:leucyl-tRNA synthetase